MSSSVSCAGSVAANASIFTTYRGLPSGVRSLPQMSQEKWSIPSVPPGVTVSPQWVENPPQVRWRLDESDEGKATAKEVQIFHPSQVFCCLSSGILLPNLRKRQDCTL